MDTITTIDPRGSDALSALLQLSSPALPVGAFSYSQALEAAVEQGLVHDANSAEVWIADQLALVLGAYEAPLWLRMKQASSSQKWARLDELNGDFIATRESRELRAETLQMGYSLMRLAGELSIPVPFRLVDVAFPTAHAWLAEHWQIPDEPGLQAYLYAWLENQIAAAIKAVPLGQAAGQRMLLSLRPVLLKTVREAAHVPDDALSSQAPMLAILSSQHEIQYSRLFRS